jgi:hypothetical protein
MPAVLSKAVILCASMATGLPVPADLHIPIWVQRAPTTIECNHTIRAEAGCGAVMMRVGGRVGAIMPRFAPWHLQVHEACHVLQFSLGLDHTMTIQAMERQCEEAERKTGVCVRLARADQAFTEPR